MIKLRVMPSWLKSALVGAIAASLLSIVLNLFLPDLCQRIYRRALEIILPAPKHDAFLVLLADLYGDDADSSHRKHLANVLSRFGGFRVYSIAKTIGGDPTVGDPLDVKSILKSDAQKILKENRGDIIVYGKYFDKTYQLGFISGNTLNSSSGQDELKGYKIGANFEVPEDFTKDMEVLFRLAMLYSVNSTAAGFYDRDVVAKMPELTQKLEILIADAKWMSPSQRCLAWELLGRSYDVIASTKIPDVEYLSKSIHAYSSAIESSQESCPCLYESYYALLSSLLKAAERSSDVEEFNKAVSLFNQAIDKIPVTNSLHWQMYSDIAFGRFTMAAKLRRLDLAICAYNTLSYAAKVLCHPGNATEECLLIQTRLYAARALVDELESRNR